MTNKALRGVGRACAAVGRGIKHGISACTSCGGQGRKSSRVGEAHLIPLESGYHASHGKAEGVPFGHGALRETNAFLIEEQKRSSRLQSRSRGPGPALAFGQGALTKWH
jgi:hypothetical protein